jgi:GNAT superfamily N-acetyltransferase
VSEIEIRVLDYNSAIAQQMLAKALADLAARYGGSGDDSPIAASEFEPPDGAFLVAFLDGRPVGCGGWRSFGDDGKIAELKRLYTVPEARGRGVARAVLAAVENSARQYGRRRLILECGDKQPEAIAMYEKLGYERIEDFGYHKDYPGVRSYGRDL